VNLDVFLSLFFAYLIVGKFSAAAKVHFSNLAVVEHGQYQTKF